MVAPVRAAVCDSTPCKCVIIHLQALGEKLEAATQAAARVLVGSSGPVGLFCYPSQG
jgi:hypothetical protein